MSRDGPRESTAAPTAARAARASPPLRRRAPAGHVRGFWDDHESFKSPRGQWRNQPLPIPYGFDVEMRPAPVESRESGVAGDEMPGSVGPGFEGGESSGKKPRRPERQRAAARDETRRSRKPRRSRYAADREEGPIEFRLSPIPSSVSAFRTHRPLHRALRRNTMTADQDA